MADKPFFIGESMFSFPVFISETLDQANNSIIKIIQMSTLISVSAEIVKINKEIQISCITIQA